MWEIKLVPVRILKYMRSEQYQHWTGPTKILTLPIERVIPVTQLMESMGFITIGIKEI